MSSITASPVSALAYEIISFPGTGKHQTLNLNYVIRRGNVTKKTGCAPLTFRVNVSGTVTSKDVELDTKQKINPDHWDFEKKCLKPNCPDYETTTAQLAELKIYLNSLFCILTNDSKEITPIQIKETYESKTKPQTEKPAQVYTLLNTIDEFIVEFEEKTKLPKDDEDHRSEFTLRQWRATRNKLIGFLNYSATKQLPLNSRKKQKTAEERLKYIEEGKQYDIPLSEVSLLFLRKFKVYLTRTRKGELLQDSSASKHLKNTKQILTYATDQKYIIANPLESYKSKNNEKEVIPLDYAEIEAIEVNEDSYQGSYASNIAIWFKYLLGLRTKM